MILHSTLCVKLKPSDRYQMTTSGQIQYVYVLDFLTGLTLLDSHFTLQQLLSIVFPYE